MIRSRKLVVMIATIFAVTALSSVSLWAQFSSAIEGTVIDPSSAVVPSATVTLMNLETGTIRRVQVGETGYYRFTSLPVAVFKITVTASGFKTVVQENVRTEVAETRTVNITLQLGTATSEVTVTAPPPLVETSEGRVSNLIGGDQVHELPMVGRNVYSLVVLTPGVTGLPTGGGLLYAQATGDIFNPEFGVNLNASGLRSESNRLLVDSADVTSYITRGVANLTPNADAIQEMRVEVTNFSAQYPAAAGAIVNATTKQGTNNWHGTAAWYHTDNALQERNEFQDTVPVFRRNEAIWSLGGPIWKDHTFVFGSMDILKSGVGIGEVATVPTSQFINFMEQNQPNKISTFLLKTYPADVTPVQNFSTAGSLLGTDCSTLASPGTAISSPVGNIACNLPVTGEGPLVETIPRNGFQWTVRVDQMFNHDKDRLYGVAFRTSRHATAYGEPDVYPDFAVTEPDYSLFFNVNETHTFSPTVVNQMGFSYSRPTGFDPCNHCEVPGLSVIGMTAGLGGTNGFAPGLFIQNNFEWRDVAAFNRGSHAFKAGVNLQTGESWTLGFAPLYTRPIYSFDSVLDFANDSPYYQTQQIINPVTGQYDAQAGDNDRNHAWGAFIQDDWKAKPNLTFNLGLRWEDMGNFRERSCDETTGIVFQGGSDFFSRIANAKMDIVCPMLKHPLDNNWGPRFGFAWDPTKQGKMSVRGGFGIFYDKISKGTPLDNTPRNPPVAAAVVGSIYTPPFLPVYALGKSGTVPFGFPLPANLVLGLDAKNGLLAGPVYTGVMDPNLRPQYTENWFFGIQYSLTRNWVLEADQMGSAGHREYVALDENRFAGDLIKNNDVLTRLNHSFGEIEYAQAEANSFYSGMTVAVKNRTTHGLSTQVAYTLGKAIDDGSISRTLPIPFPDATNLRDMRGLSDFDVRQKLAFSVLWELPRPNSSSAFLNKFLSRWQLADVTILQSGSPFSVWTSAPFEPVYNASGVIIGNSGGDYNADGGDYDFPNTPAFGNSKSGLSRSDYIKGIFTASAFPVPALGQEGNLGKNTFIGPGFANSDFSIFKNTKIPWFVGKEGADLQFRGEFFNVFNRVNLTQVDGDLVDPTFGTSTGTYAARNIQFSLRLTF